VDRRGPLDHTVAVRDDPDQQLGRLVLRLLEEHRAGHLGAHRAQAERGVADLLAGERADRQREEPHAGLAHRVLGFLAAQPA
jgi:hypothetical protein